MMGHHLKIIKNMIIYSQIPILKLIIQIQINTKFLMISKFNLNLTPFLKVKEKLHKFLHMIKNIFIILMAKKNLKEIFLYTQ